MAKLGRAYHRATAGRAGEIAAIKEARLQRSRVIATDVRDARFRHLGRVAASAARSQALRRDREP